MALERELCDYLMLRHVLVDETKRSSGKVPAKLLKVCKVDLHVRMKKGARCRDV